MSKMRDLQIPNAAAKWFFDKDVLSFSWSVATNYVIDNENSFYVRFADGEHATPNVAATTTANPTRTIEKNECLRKMLYENELNLVWKLKFPFYALAMRSGSTTWFAASVIRTRPLIRAPSTTTIDRVSMSPSMAADA